MASKKKKKVAAQVEVASTESASSPPAANSDSEPRLQLVTIARPRRVLVDNWKGEAGPDGVVEHNGERCFVQQVG